MEKVKCIEFPAIVNKVLLMKKGDDNVVYVFKDGLYIGGVRSNNHTIEGSLNTVKREILNDTSYLYRLQYSS